MTKSIAQLIGSRIAAQFWTTAICCLELCGRGVARESIMTAEELSSSPPNPTLEMVTYIQNRFVHRPGVQVSPDTRLVSSGLIDSFALIEIFLKLEHVTGRKIPASKVQAKDMDSIQLMLATAERIGKPRQ